MSTPNPFEYDVFLSHNANDKPKVRRLAERLRAAGLRVWFDEWIIRPGDDIFLSVERGLEVARTLVLCLSPNAVASGWVSTERSTVLFRDPTNKNRRFVPLLLSACDLPDTLKRYKHIAYESESDAAFAELLAACQPSERSSTSPGSPTATAQGVASASDAPQPGSLAGNWVATLSKPESKDCQIFLTLEVMDDLVFGSVSYPTGNAGILDGKLTGGTLSFHTRHVPSWSPNEVTIKWVGKVAGEKLQGVTQDPGGTGKFVAERTTNPHRYGWRASASNRKPQSPD